MHTFTATRIGLTLSSVRHVADNTPGWAYLADQVAGEFRKLLNMSANELHDRRDDRGRVASKVSAAAAATLTCPDGKTACPASTTCVADQFSNTKWGCCMLPDATSCDDEFHCCGGGLRCKPNGTNPITPKKPNPENYNHVCV